MARTSAAHSISSSRVVAKMRPLGIAPRQWPHGRCAADATAIERGEPIWQTRSTKPTSMPSSSEAVATSTRISPVFSLLSAARRSLRDRLPWCGGDNSSPRRSRQMMRDALGQPPRVDEHQRGTVLPNQLGDAVVDLVPLFVGSDRTQLARGHFDGQIELRAVADVDDRRRRAGLRRSGSARSSRSAFVSPTDRSARRRAA